MPATFTHYYFGKKVYEALSPSYRQMIQKHRSLYDIGLHGPDILFYHFPLFDNKIMQLGYDLHDVQGKYFFMEASKRHHHKEEDLSYLYGFICHFTLDAFCHPYVERYIEEYNVSHFEIEMQFDRYLLEVDKQDIFRYPLSQHIHPSKNNEQVISRYFNGTQGKDIHQALIQMKAIHRLFQSSSDVKRWVLYHGMDLLRLNKYKEQIISKYPNPLCAKSNDDMHQLLNQAISKAVELIECYAKDGAADKLYHHTFGND